MLPAAVEARVEEMLPVRLEAEIEKRSVGISNTAGMMQLLNIATEGGVPNVSDNTIETIPALVRAVNIVAGACAKLPVTVYSTRGGKTTRRDDHPVALLINNSPDGQLTPYRFWWNMWANRFLSGGGGAEIIRNLNGNPIALRLMRYGAQPYQIRREDPLYYWDNEDGKLYAAEDVVFLPGLMVRSGHTVCSLAQAFRNTFGETLAQSMLSMTLFKQGLYPKAVLSYVGTKATLNGDKEAADEIMRYYGGLDRAGGIIPVRNMDKLMPWPQQSMVDAQMMEMRKWSSDQIAIMFGIPPDMLGNNDKQSYSYSESSAKSFIMYTLDPLLTERDQEVKMKLFADSEKAFTNVETQVNEQDWMLSKDRAEYWWKKFQMGALSPNEIRAYENEQPVEGGDQRFVQTNLIPIDQVKEFYSSQTSNTGSQPTEAQRSLKIEPPTGEKLNGHHVEN